MDHVLLHRHIEQHLERPQRLVNNVVHISFPHLRSLHGLVLAPGREHRVPAQMLSKPRERRMVDVGSQVRVEFPQGPVHSQPLNVARISVQRAPFTLRACREWYTPHVNPAFS